MTAVLARDPFLELAERDPAVAELARLESAALAAIVAVRPGRERFRENAEKGLPLLHQAVLGVDETALSELASILGSILDPIQAVQATIVGEPPDLHAQLIARPVLLECARVAAPHVSPLPAETGWCPVCAAWPLIAESRGLERERWLRCGRCGTGWRADPGRCCYCGNRDHRMLGYLAAEGQGEARRVLTCDGCGGYLKAIATLAAPSAAEIVLADLSTVELDLAAVDRGFDRPAGLGCPLEVRIVPMSW